MTSTTERYRAAASQSASTVEKVADFWTQGSKKLADYAPAGVPQVDLVPIVERYFEFVQRTVDISRNLTIKWAEAAGTLSGVVRGQAESVGGLVRDQAESVGGLVHEQAESARDFAHEQAARPSRPPASWPARPSRPRRSWSARLARPSVSRPSTPMTRPASATKA